METINGLAIPTALTIIHSTGVFVHNIVWYDCPGTKNQWHLQLLKAGLFPASTTRPQTAFTFEVLDHFLIDALECKTSASSFFEKICQMTNNAFPDTVPSRYQELMRVSQLWRDFMSQKWFGFGHDVEKEPGKVGLFHKDMWWTDISLSDGLRYMVKEREYQTHLSLAVESKECSSCSNHQAINAANISRSNLQTTGVGATACARHGCFVPHSIVDFQKGEREWPIAKACLCLKICTSFQWLENSTSALINWLALQDTASTLFKGLDKLMGRFWRPFGIMKTLLTKYKQALKGVDQTKPSFDELTQSLDPGKILMWEIDEQKAMEEHGEYLDIYQLQMNKALTMAEIYLKLTESENADTGKPGTVSWLITGINLEDLHMDLRMATVHSDDPRFCHADNDGYKWEEVSDGEISEDLDEEILAEEMGIWMPSSVAHHDALTLGLGPLQAEELELRKGQANDCLESLQMALGHKAIIYHQYFQSADSTWAGTRSKQEAHRCQLKIDNIDKEVIEENRFGQGSDKLAWFWRVNNAGRGQEDAWMDELYRVNWLKAKARWSRWQEELSLVRHKMGWIIKWFKYYEKE
ncbi:hypothetical protein BDR04DRAFT_1118593 [Suillus decipiens]|nr:hypothetical protein BDR04DRAFT_1118593 [Suillus decipiens]